MRPILFSMILAAAMISCNPKKSDQIADEAAKNRKAFLHDSTTVEVIDLKHDFGKIKQGDKVEYSFRFRNSGNKPLIIEDAKSTCGCTVPEWPEKPVLPGDTAFLKVVFNSEGKEGTISKPIMVTSNAKPKFPDLELTGFVEVKK